MTNDDEKTQKTDVKLSVDQSTKIVRKERSSFLDSETVIRPMPGASSPPPVEGDSEKTIAMATPSVDGPPVQVVRRARSLKANRPVVILASAAALSLVFLVFLKVRAPTSQTQPQAPVESQSADSLTKDQFLSLMLRSMLQTANTKGQ